MPLLEALSQFQWETTLAVGLKITEVAWVGILAVFAVSYLTKQLGMSQAFVLEAITVATFVESFAMPLAGWLSEERETRRVGERSDLQMALIDVRAWTKGLPDGWVTPVTILVEALSDVVAALRTPAHLIPLSGTTHLNHWSAEWKGDNGQRNRFSAAWQRCATGAGDVRRDRGGGL
jgi:hypothetical protein